MALHAEAEALIQALKLHKESDKISLYATTDYRLIITGIGLEKSAVAVGYYAGKYGFNKADQIFNIGTAGSRVEKNLHQLFSISKVHATYDDRIYHLDPDPRFENASLATYPKAVTPSETPRSELVDMEASALIRALQPFASLSQLHIYKIVSDRLDPKEAKASIRPSIAPHIESLCEVLV